MSKLLDMFEKLEKPVKVQDLKPPQPAIIERLSLDEIEFQKIANSSEFKRLVYLIWFGKTHRGKSNDLERQLVERKEEISLVEVIKHDSALIREIRSNPLYMKQKSLHNK